MVLHLIKHRFSFWRRFMDSVGGILAGRNDAGGSRKPMRRAVSMPDLHQQCSLPFVDRLVGLVVESAALRRIDPLDSVLLTPPQLFQSQSIRPAEVIVGGFRLSDLDSLNLRVKDLVTGGTVILSIPDDGCVRRHWAYCSHHLFSYTVLPNGCIFLAAWDLGQRATTDQTTPIEPQFALELSDVVINGVSGPLEVRTFDEGNSWYFAISEIKEEERFEPQFRVVAFCYNPSDQDHELWGWGHNVYYGWNSEVASVPKEIFGRLARIDGKVQAVFEWEHQVHRLSQGSDGPAVLQSSSGLTAEAGGARLLGICIRSVQGGDEILLVRRSRSGELNGYSNRLQIEVLDREGQMKCGRNFEGQFVDARCACLAKTAEGELLVLGCHNGNVYTVDLDTWEQKAHFNLDAQGRSIEQLRHIPGVGFVATLSGQESEEQVLFSLWSLKVHSL